MGKSRLALVLVLFTVVISSALAEKSRPEEVFRQCQQKCQSQSRYGRGEVGQYECQMRCVKELERQTPGRGDYGGRGDRDINIDVNESRGYKYDQQGEDFERFIECVEKCSLQQAYQGQECLSQCLQGQQGRQGDIDMNESRSSRGGYGEHEEFGECFAKCSDKEPRQQYVCLVKCLEQHQQGQQGQRGQQQDNQEWDPEHHGRRGGQDYERYGECMQQCSRQPGQQQQYCTRQCQQQQKQGSRGQQQDNQEWDPEHGSHGRHGGQGYERYERYGECMQKCSRQPGQQQKYCTKQCQQQQGSRGQQQDNQEWDPEHGSRGRHGGQGYERYERYGECMQKCSRQPGQQQQYCTKQCQQQQQQQEGYPSQRRSQTSLKSRGDRKQKEYSYECIQKCEARGEEPYECQKSCIQGKSGHGRGRGGDITGLTSILKLTAGLFN